jgi:hypothetical protein
MPWRRSTADPTTDPVAYDVIAAFEQAVEAGLETSSATRRASTPGAEPTPTKPRNTPLSRL